VILAAHRFGIATKEEAKTLERGWNRYRAEQNLDLYGKHDASGSKTGSHVRNHH
jgi:hypothetical protein